MRILSAQTITRIPSESNGTPQRQRVYAFKCGADIPVCGFWRLSSRQLLGTRHLCRFGAILLIVPENSESLIYHLEATQKSRS
jgi:hypothetical protein